MKKLKFENNAIFPQCKIEVKGFKGLKQLNVFLQKDYNEIGDGIYWLLNAGVMLKSEYTKEEKEAQRKLNNEEPIRNNDIVVIDGEQYKVQVFGDYSDCAVFEKI